MKINLSGKTDNQTVETSKYPVDNGENPIVDPEAIQEVRDEKI